MDAKTQRELRRSSETTQDRLDFKEEKEHYPLLHSGFVEPTTADENVSAHFLSIWFANGSYRCKLLDREGQEKAFLNAGRLVDVFAKLEEGLRDLSLDWQRDEPRRNGRFGS